jgi:hypothetical protein
MLHRIVRPAVIALLLLSSLASAAFLWISERRIDLATQQARTADKRTETVEHQLADLRTALHAYVAPGQNITEWAARAEALVGELTQDAEALEQSGETELAREVLRPAIASLTRLNGGVREYLRSGDDLMAADLAFTEAGNAMGAAVTALHEWREIKGAAAAREIKFTPMRRTMTLTAALLPLVLCLGVVGWKREAPGAADAGAPMAHPATSAASGDAGPETAVLRAKESGLRTGVDLTAAAAACDALARAGDGTALKAALGQGAAALGAKGVVVWLGVADQLFAVASHGYDERHLRRPVARDAENVTAETWRTGKAVTITGDADTPGVVVVPMAGAGGCRGVVSAELRPGCMAVADRQALLAMFAAQLGGIVGAAAPATGAPRATAPAPLTEAPATSFDELTAAVATPSATERAS